MTPTRTFDMNRMPSRHVTHGTENALQRMYYYAMGLDSQDIARPHVGVGASWTGSDPLGDLPLHTARIVEQGVRLGGALPRTFGLVSDGANANAAGDGQSALLVGRELVADSFELTVRGHSYDAMVGIGGCASSITGMLLAMCRLDVPSVLVPIVGSTLGSGADDLAMALVAATLGIAPPGLVSTTMHPHQLDAAWRDAGTKVADLLAAGRSPRRIVTDESLLASAAVIATVGGAPYLAIDLVAIARECGSTLTLAQFVDVIAHTPQRWPDPSVALRDRGAQEILALSRVSRTVDHARVAVDATVAWAGGSLAPEGAIVMAPPGAEGEFRGLARVFDGEAAAVTALAHTGWSPGTVVVVRGVGPAGGPGMPVLTKLARVVARLGPVANIVLVTDARLPAIPGVVSVSAVGPEAARGGPLAALRSDVTVTVDLTARTVNAQAAAISPTACAGVDASLPPVIAKYACLVGPAVDGASTHPGAAGELTRYADL
jgi:dihydroxy-acid dehydratase